MEHGFDLMPYYWANIPHLIAALAYVFAGVTMIAHERSPLHNVRERYQVLAVIAFFTLGVAIF